VNITSKPEGHPCVLSGQRYIRWIFLHCYGNPSLDVGVSNDRTVLAVMHAEDSPDGRRVVLDAIDRWQGTRAAPVDLGEVRDTLIRRCREYRASAIVDPHEAVLIAQEARGAGVRVVEFAFTAASVGRLALSLHQAIRGHRIALPDDEILLD
jgi:hypothetical protein